MSLAISTTPGYIQPIRNTTQLKYGQAQNTGGTARGHHYRTAGSMDEIFKRIPIIDAHQHFWDPTVNYHPWLCDEPPIPFRYGDYSSLRRPYLPAEYLRDTAGYPVKATVYIETEWAEGAAIKEMDYVASLRGQTGFPTVAVAQAVLDKPDIAQALEKLSRIPFVRGIRNKPRANAAPDSGLAGGTLDAQWRAGYARLAEYGLRFDLQTPWWHLHEAARLAHDFPTTQVIINHSGLPADRSPAGLSAWRSALKEVADCPNMSIKISGLGIPEHPWTVSDNREIILEVIDTFGVGRCMFASNFPVDGLCATFETIFDGFAETVRSFSASEQRSLFHDNAARIYGIEPDHQHE